MILFFCVEGWDKSKNAMSISELGEGEMKQNIPKNLTTLATAVLVAGATWYSGAHAGDWNPDSNASNLGSIVNTRHNLTQRPFLTPSSTGSDTDWFMSLFRNQYNEVCVYCHTPHGANAQGHINRAPLWNRSAPSNTYTIYSELKTSTLSRPMSQPGVNSLTCLSCHDGTVAIDSVINMPTSGFYNASQETARVDNAASQGFLDTWAQSGKEGPSPFMKHLPLAGNELGPGQSCTICHNEGPQFDSMDNFADFLVGKDLRNDHPVGILYPTDFSSGDFNQPNQEIAGRMSYFDSTTSGKVNHADPNEVRLYETGDGFEVECASCHDPHGVRESSGPNAPLIASFLRVDNDGSRLCLTCHIK